MKNSQISVLIQSSLSTCEQETCLGDIGNMSGEQTEIIFQKLSQNNLYLGGNKAERFIQQNKFVSFQMWRKGKKDILALGKL